MTIELASHVKNSTPLLTSVLNNNEKDYLLNETFFQRICLKTFAYIAQFFKRITYSIHDYLFTKDLNVIVASHNRVACQTTLAAFTTKFSPLTTFNFKDIGFKHDVAISRDISLSPWRGCLCVGMALRFCKEMLNDIESTEKLSEKVLRAATLLEDGADREALMLQHTYETLLASNINYPNKVKVAVQEVLSVHSSHEFLTAAQENKNHKAYAAFLDQIHNDHSLRTGARQTLGEMYDCHLSEVQVDSIDLATELSQLDNGYYMIFFNNHSFAYLLDNDDSFLFDADRGTFDCKELALKNVLEPIEKKYGHMSGFDQKLTIMQVSSAKGGSSEFV